MRSANICKKRAFTLIEIIFVIVILGIVGMIGSSVIAKMYQGYIKSKIVNDLQTKTDLVLDQITKRLEHRIKETAIARNSTDQKYLPLNDENLSQISPDMIEWIGYDYESYLGDNNGTYSTPGWSGFIDVDSAETNKTSVLTPGSDLNYTDSVIRSLSYGDVNLTNDGFTDGESYPVLIPKCQKDSNLSLYGWDIPNNLFPMDNNNTFEVRNIIGDNEHLFFRYKNTKPICEQYYLAWSAYAIVPKVDLNKKNDFKLYLHYSYQPWVGENYNCQNTKKSLLAEHVSTFRVLQVGDSVRVKICLTDGNITGTAYGFCKEKVVF